MLDHLLDRAVSSLRFNGQVTRGLTVTIRYGDYESAHGRETFRRSTDQEQLLKEAARDRLRRLYDRRMPLWPNRGGVVPLGGPAPRPRLFLPRPAAAESPHLA